MPRSASVYAQSVQVIWCSNASLNTEIQKRKPVLGNAQFGVRYNIMGDFFLSSLNVTFHRKFKYTVNDIDIRTSTLLPEIVFTKSLVYA